MLVVNPSFTPNCGRKRGVMNVGPSTSGGAERRDGGDDQSASVEDTITLLRRSNEQCGRPDLEIFDAKVRLDVGQVAASGRLGEVIGGGSNCSIDRRHKKHVLNLGVVLIEKCAAESLG